MSCTPANRHAQPATPSQADWPDAVQRALGDPGASFWLKGALTGAIQRDPDEALQDAWLLVSILQCRALDHAVRKGMGR